MKYKVGDVVRIKSRNKLRNIESHITGKLGYAGLTATILTADVGVDGNDEGYKIDLDKKEWWWFDMDFDDSFSYNPEKSILSEEMIKDIAEVVKKYNLGVCVSEKEGSIIIEPLKAEEDLPIDTPVIVSTINKKDWKLRYYAGNKQCYGEGDRSNDYRYMSSWDCIIPFDRFSPNDIEESLKYNIVK